MPRSPATDPHAIGGVFAIGAPGAPVPGNLWELWTDAAAQALTFVNARSGFAHILQCLAPRRIWLPAYCCADMAEATRAPLIYGGDDTLTPDVDALDEALRPGDLVLGLNHFGRPNANLAALARSRPDVTWVEDCAQAADTGATPWADLRLFSPRKLLAVPDGGILVDARGLLPAPRQRPAATARLRHAGLMRAADPQDRNNAAWYAAFQRAEAAMTVSDHAMSAHTRNILQGTRADALIAARRANYARLHAHLSDLALWPDPAPKWTPLGFPIRVPDAAALGAGLARERIFAPRHWPRLVTNNPPPSEAMLQKQLLTLPCDQRYGAADMDRIAAAVRTVLR
ncbi:hypothetical protein ACN2XU_08975 [Primorskyibacter sp. 2E107]|uniref:hypothetical protein n=1 Tax=Primorskyibacter sp. 2E107 TaxID=3403458 RepID=UPI003AF4C59E